MKIKSFEYEIYHVMFLCKICMKLVNIIRLLLFKRNVMRLFKCKKENIQFAVKT